MKNQAKNPHTKYPIPPFPKQEQNLPGTEDQMKPLADHGEDAGDPQTIRRELPAAASTGGRGAHV